MKVQIIGGTGFIGGHLMNYLQRVGEEVISLSLREDDWRDKIDDDAYAIVNLVGKAHDHKRNTTEDEYYNTNLKLVQELFKEFLNSNAQLFVHLSSIACVEEFEADVPINEEVECHPISIYGKSKRAAEEWLLDQYVPIDKKVIILRPPMVYGSGDKGNLMRLYKFVSKGFPYPLSGFKNLRSFISIDNLSFFIFKILKNNSIENGIYHVADDESISTKEIVEIIYKVKSRKVFSFSFPRRLIEFLAKLGDVVPLPLNTKSLKKMTASLLVSNTKLKNALKIEKLPETTQEALEKTIRSFAR